MKKNTDKIIAQLPIESATYLLNEKRSSIEDIENRQKVTIIIVPNKHMETPDFDIQRIRASGGEEEQTKTSSYQLIRSEGQSLPEFAREAPIAAEQAVVREFLPSSPAPATVAPETRPLPPTAPTVSGGGLIKRFLNILTGKEDKEAPALRPVVPPPRPSPTIQDRPRPPQERQQERRPQQPQRAQRPQQQRQDRQERTERLPAEPRQERPESRQGERRQILPRHGAISSGSVPSFANQATQAPRVTPPTEIQAGIEEENGLVLDSGVKRDAAKRGSRRRRGRRGEGANRNPTGIAANPEAEKPALEAGTVETAEMASEEAIADVRAGQPAWIDQRPGQEKAAIPSIPAETGTRPPIIPFAQQPKEEAPAGERRSRSEQAPRKHQQRPPRPRPATTYIDWVEPPTAPPAEETPVSVAIADLARPEPLMEEPESFALPKQAAEQPAPTAGEAISEPSPAQPPKHPLWQPTPNVALKTDPERPWLHIIVPAEEPVREIPPPAEMLVTPAKAEPVEAAPPVDAVSVQEPGETPVPVGVRAEAEQSSPPSEAESRESETSAEEGNSQPDNEVGEAASAEETEAREQRRPANRRRSRRGKAKTNGEAIDEADDEATPAANGGEGEAMPENADIRSGENE